MIGLKETLWWIIGTLIFDWIAERIRAVPFTVLHLNFGMSRFIYSCYCIILMVILFRSELLIAYVLTVLVKNRL